MTNPKQVSSPCLNPTKCGSFCSGSCAFRTAEDVAEKIARHIISEVDEHGLGTVSDWKEFVTSQLTAFADERVSDLSRDANIILETSVEAARAEGYTQGCADTLHNSPMFDEGRKEGLEEAAKVAERNIESNHVEDIPKEIRALKIAKPEGGQ